LSSAPTGRSKAARATPRVIIAQAFISPVRAAQLWLAVERRRRRADWAALTGLGFLVVRGPRALPGSVLDRPVGAETGGHEGPDERGGQTGCLGHKEADACAQPVGNPL
jgi:hypothetical protein